MQARSLSCTVLPRVFQSQAYHGGTTDIKWIRRKESVSFQFVYSVIEQSQIKIKESTLTIKSTAAEDDGEWECRAGNYLGRISHTFDVEIQVKLNN